MHSKRIFCSIVWTYALTIVRNCLMLHGEQDEIMKGVNKKFICNDAIVLEEHIGAKCCNKLQQVKVL